MERYGVVLTVADIQQLMLDIIDTVAGERRAALLQERRKRSGEVWLVLHRGIALRVGYDPATARITTALPWRRDARC